MHTQCPLRMSCSCMESTPQHNILWVAKIHCQLDLPNLGWGLCILAISCFWTGPITEQSHIYKQASQEAVPVSSEHQRIHPSHPLYSLPILHIKWERQATDLIHAQDLTKQGISHPIEHWHHWAFAFKAGHNLGQLMPSWIESLPSFEPVVTAAAVVPDARPTGLECFPALPGILSPLGFNIFAASCMSD